MVEHDCKYDVDIALMAADIKSIKDDVKNLIALIQGNGDSGLKGQVKSGSVQLKLQWALLFVIVVALIAGKLF